MCFPFLLFLFDLVFFFFVFVLFLFTGFIYDDKRWSSGLIRYPHPCHFFYGDI